MGSLRVIRRVNLRRRGAEARHAVAGQENKQCNGLNVEDHVKLVIRAREQLYVSRIPSK